MAERADLQGTLDLIVLRVLALGPMHRYGIALRIRQISEEVLSVNQGSLYPALLRVEQQGRIRGEWGASEHNRRAKFYSLTAGGHRQLARETAQWERVAGAIARLLAAT